MVPDGLLIPVAPREVRHDPAGRDAPDRVVPVVREPQVSVGAGDDRPRAAWAVGRELGDDTCSVIPADPVGRVLRETGPVRAGRDVTRARPLRWRLGSEIR